ncbi:MAG: hypothetical protein AAGH15_17715 [Myxococcota bacterium]
MVCSPLTSTGAALLLLAAAVSARAATAPSERAYREQRLAVPPQTIALRHAYPWPVSAFCLDEVLVATQHSVELRLLRGRGTVTSEGGRSTPIFKALASGELEIIGSHGAVLFGRRGPDPVTVHVLETLVLASPASPQHVDRRDDAALRYIQLGGESQGEVWERQRRSRGEKAPGP